MITKPMLSGKLDDEKQVTYPTWVTPKLDGIRCLVVDGKALTRKFKPVPNHYIRTQIEKYCPNGFDGEIMSKDRSFNDLQSLVMSEEGEPEFEYHVFDYVKDSIDKSYLDRIKDLKQEQPTTFVKFVIPVKITNEEELLNKEAEYLKAGYEGIMLRSALGPYKCGRSTVKEAYLLKLKRFQDSEAKVIDIERLYHNANEAEKDELGHTKRSHKQEGMVPMDKVGAFVVRDLNTDQEFRVSTGLVDEERVRYWETKDQLIGKILRYRYQSKGMKNLPRFPVFFGFRDERDM
jgi:DNA ligase-1